MELKFNKYQTELTEELLESLPREVRAELLEIINDIPFVQNLTAPEEVRGFAKDRHHDNEGKVIVDVTNPHILEDMDYFRQAAIHHEKYGCYTLLHKNSNPKSEYALFWKEESRRWKEGLIRPSDGEWIPGNYYFYLNYSPIWINEKDENTLVTTVNNRKKAKVKGIRKKEFPRIWLGDYLWFHYMDQARQDGGHCKLLKMRGVGFSYKFGAITPCKMYTEPGLPNFHLASDKNYLLGDKGVYGKVVDTLDWIGSHTPFPKLRLVDKPLEKQLGYKDSEDIRRGLLSSVYGISLKDDPDKARGVRGPIIHYEEDGLFPNLEEAWNINRAAVEDGNIVYGQMVAGGCICAGTKVWDNYGNLVNIEDIDIQKGILGFNKEEGKVSKELITYWQLPSEKPCYRITTNTGRYLECSEDHPILWSRQNFGSSTRSKVNKELRIFKKQTIFKLAKEIQIGDQLAIAEEVNVFGELEMWEPRMIGWLIGDGTYGIDHSPRLANCEIEINDYVKERFDAKVTRSHITKEGKIYEEIRLKGICCKLRELGIYGQTKLNKRLPVNIHSYRMEDICELVGGLFDTDGYISKTRISISSAGYELLAELRLLLQKLGIHGNINYKNPNINNPRSKNGHFELEIASKQSILNFLQYITLYPAHKKSALNNLYKSISTNKGRISTNIKGIVFERVTKIEYIGLNPIYNLTAGTTNTYLANGIITHNTGGTTGSNFAGSEKLFYNPEAYNIYGLPNVYDKKAQRENYCGFFWGAYLNRAECYDKVNGEPNVIKALIEVLKDRHYLKTHSTDPVVITQRKAEFPLTPQEAIMLKDGSIFPVSDLKDYRAEILPNLRQFVKAHDVVRLKVNNEGVVDFVPTDKTPIRDYPVNRGTDTEGAVEIFRHPIRDINGKTPRLRYIAGIDPITDDVVHDSVSLGSIFIFDRLTDQIVAEYTGRTKTAYEFYEICRRLLMYYGATANYENNLKGLFSYFQNQQCLNLLCDTPSILKDMDMVKGVLYGNKSKGSPATQSINSWARRLQADWLVSSAYNEDPENPEGLLNLHKVRSLGYLEELIQWNLDINTDRVSAMGMVMIYREELKKYEVKQVKEKVKTLADDPFFNRHFRSGSDLYNQYADYRG